MALSSLLAFAGCTSDDGTGDHCDEDGHCEDESALYEAAYDEGRQPGKDDGTDCSGVRVPDRSGFNKRIALTFDDGPNPATTPNVIETLRRHSAPAAFFINGKRLANAQAKQIAAEVAADPLFILANHSQNHSDLATLSIDEVRVEMDRTGQLVTEAGETMRYFRFPFGSSTCTTMREVKDRAWISTGWHIDSADWCFAAGGGECPQATFKYVPDDMRDSMSKYVMSQVHTTGGGMLLFHDIHPSTANNLDAMLTELENAGYTFVRIDDHAAFPKLHGVPEQPTRFVGDTCTTHADCAFSAYGKPGRCHPAGFCTVSCEGSCPDMGDYAPTFCIADTAPSAVSPGICVSKPAAQNQLCLGLPGTTKREMDRFIGTGTSAPARSVVCAPR
ncbi:MAG: polysaccharide deacetylase family protein [Kofleriaceae bacterium]|nr:polysaccharide deacetylase family protein [Kofleriaceae bacterium]